MKTISIVAAAAALFGRSLAVGDCDENGPWASHSVGYDTGGPWCATHWKDGAAINGIQAWANGDSINGISFQYTNNVASDFFGQQTGDASDVLTWDTTQEEVESIKIWPNGKSDVRRVGAIEIQIKGRDGPWKAGKPQKKTQSYSSPVVAGAGIIMGAFGNAGGSIDMLAFLMMDSGIKNKDITDFGLDQASLDAANDELKKAEAVSVDSFSQENWTGENMTYSVNRVTRKLRTWSSTKSSSSTFGGSVGASMDVGLPSIGLGGSINTEYHWEQTNSYETSSSGEDEVTLDFTISGKVPKGEAIYCESLAFSGKYDLDYTSQIDLELQSGRTWSYKEAGTLQGVAWSKNENKCISYGKGEDGAEVLQKKLAEWKNNPDKEKEDEEDRENRAEEDEKKEDEAADDEGAEDGNDADDEDDHEVDPGEADVQVTQIHEFTEASSTVEATSTAASLNLNFNLGDFLGGLTGATPTSASDDAEADPTDEASSKEAKPTPSSKKEANARRAQVTPAPVVKNLKRRLAFTA